MEKSLIYIYVFSIKIQLKKSILNFQAGAIAEEVFSGIRTVFAFGGQEKELQRYQKHLTEARKSGIIRGMLTGSSGGMTFGIMYAVYGLGFWFGVKLIMDDR